jgi:ribosomal RNA-processing protein 8
MSLFASAFETSTAGPSSFTAPALGKSHKDGKKGQNKPKKRASLGGDGAQGKPDLRATEQNLAKLMKRVEAGDIKEKRGGGENMGGQGKGKGKGKGMGKKGGAGVESDDEVPAPPQSQKAGVHGQAREQGPKRKRDGEVSVSTPQKKAQLPPTPVAKQANGKGRVAPAELPLPHTIPKSELHSSAVADASLTDMQKSMQAKLEGARFR